MEEDIAISVEVYELLDDGDGIFPNMPEDDDEDSDDDDDSDDEDDDEDD